MCPNHKNAMLHTLKNYLQFLKLLLQIEKFCFINSSQRYYEIVIVPVILTRWQCTHKMAVLGNSHAWVGMVRSCCWWYIHTSSTRVSCLLCCIVRSINIRNLISISWHKFKWNYLFPLHSCIVFVSDMKLNKIIVLLVML